MHEEYDNVTLLVDNSTDVIKSDLVGYHNLEKIDDKDKKLVVILIVWEIGDK